MNEGKVRWWEKYTGVMSGMYGVGGRSKWLKRLSGIKGEK
jgi:hypothetical protein